MDETQPTNEREELIALSRRRRRNRVLDGDAALPGEDVVLRKMIALCTNAARGMYRRDFAGCFSLADAASPATKAELDAEAAQALNWEDLLIWGGALTHVEELTGKSRKEILTFALETCQPTNRQCVELELARIQTDQISATHDKFRDFVEAKILPDARKGKKFGPGRAEGAVGPIRKAMRALLEKKPTMKNDQLWRAISSKPPKGWVAYDNDVGRYFEGPTYGNNIEYKSFVVAASKERKRLKALSVISV